MKGLKKLSAMQEATDTMLRDGKMLADATAKDVRHKLANMETVKDPSGCLMATSSVLPISGMVGIQ